MFQKKVKPVRPKAFFVLGSSGSGKGTQSKLLAEKFGFFHICTGDLLRRETEVHGQHKELIEECIRLGKLVPTEIVVKLIKQEIHNQNNETVFSIDGYPRNKEEMVKWNQEIGTEVDLQHMILLNCSKGKSFERLKHRGETSCRKDDNEQSIQDKHDTYVKETIPVINRYKKEDGFVIDIDANN